MEKAYSIIETAKILGIKARTVREWIYKGKLKAYKLNGRWLIFEKDLPKG